MTGLKTPPLAQRQASPAHLQPPPTPTRRADSRARVPDCPEPRALIECGLCAQLSLGHHGGSRGPGTAQGWLQGARRCSRGGASHTCCLLLPRGCTDRSGPGGLAALGSVLRAQWCGQWAVSQRSPGLGGPDGEMPQPWALGQPSPAPAPNTLGVFPVRLRAPAWSRRDGWKTRWATVAPRPSNVTEHLRPVLGCGVQRGGCGSPAGQ